MLNSVKAVRRFSEEKTKKYEQLVQEINNLEEKLSDLSDEELRHKTITFKTCFVTEKQWMI